MRVVYTRGRNKVEFKPSNPNHGLTPAEYEDWLARRWAVRKGYKKLDKTRQLAIMGLGIGGEAGEVQELLKKHIRDDKNLGENLLLELGDVFHYTLRIGQVFGFTMQDIIDGNVDKLTARDAGKEKG